MNLLTRFSRPVRAAIGILIMFSLVALSSEAYSQDVPAPIRILILPCANGYDYSMHTLELDEQIADVLQGEPSVSVIPFPYRTLLGVNYYGVFDKQYCLPIIEKVDADVIVMNTFIGEFASEEREGLGYRIRLLNTKTMEQIESIDGVRFTSFDDLIVDLANKRPVLVSDIRSIVPASSE